jgi:hypothetical protein
MQPKSKGNQSIDNTGLLTTPNWGATIDCQIESFHWISVSRLTMLPEE